MVLVSAVADEVEEAAVAVVADSVEDLAGEGEAVVVASLTPKV